jgi:hypothetical protein
MVQKDFFDSIGQTEKHSARARFAALLPKADVSRYSRPFGACCREGIVESLRNPRHRPKPPGRVISIGCQAGARSVDGCFGCIVRPDQLHPRTERSTFFSIIASTGQIRAFRRAFNERYRPCGSPCSFFDKRALMAKPPIFRDLVSPQPAALAVLGTSGAFAPAVLHNFMAWQRVDCCSPFHHIFPRRVFRSGKAKITPPHTGT